MTALRRRATCINPSPAISDHATVCDGRQRGDRHIVDKKPGVGAGRVGMSDTEPDGIGASRTDGEVEGGVTRLAEELAADVFQGVGRRGGRIVANSKVPDDRNQGLGCPVVDRVESVIAIGTGEGGEVGLEQDFGSGRETQRLRNRGNRRDIDGEGVGGKPERAGRRGGGEGTRAVVVEREKPVVRGWVERTSGGRALSRATRRGLVVVVGIRRVADVVPLRVIRAHRVEGIGLEPLSKEIRRSQRRDRHATKNRKCAKRLEFDYRTHHFCPAFCRPRGSANMFFDRLTLHQPEKPSK